MGKSDKAAAKQGIEQGQAKSNEEYGSGIGAASSRLYGAIDPITGQRSGGLLLRADQERGALTSGYGDLARTGGLQESEYGNLMSGDYGRGYNRNYLDTYNDLSGPNGGFNTSRLGNLSQTSNYLRGLPGSNAYSDVNQGISGLLRGGNYGDINQSIGGLQDIGQTGGVSPQEISNIQRPIYSEFEQSGGFTPSDLSNIRSRSAAGASSTYSNLADQLQRERQASGQAGVLGGTGLRLARQSMSRAASLGLSRQDQINEAQKAAAGIDLQTQGLTNQARIAGAQGLQSSEERQRQLDAENQRYLISQRTAGQQAGLGGLLSTYGQTPGEASFYENLLRDYTAGQTGSNLGWNQQRIGIGSMPGLGSSIASIAGGIGGALGGFGGLLGGIGNRNQDMNYYNQGIATPWGL